MFSPFIEHAKKLNALEDSAKCAIYINLLNKIFPLSQCSISSVLLKFWKKLLIGEKGLSNVH